MFIVILYKYGTLSHAHFIVLFTYQSEITKKLQPKIVYRVDFYAEYCGYLNL